MLKTIVLAACIVSTYAVNRPPNMVTNPQKDIFYKPGESVEIVCIANGIPKPQYRWKRNGLDFNPSGNDDRVVQLPNQGTIVFNAPESKDEGIFQCFADNGYGIAVSYTVNFREAKLASFPYQERQITYADGGLSATLQCTPPQSYPPADVYWVVKETDGRWQAINFDKRMSMDIEGRLQITNVKKSDEQGGRAYCCMAINYFMRDNSIGPEHQIIVQGTTEQKSGAAELWTSPSDQFFVKNGLLKLKCIYKGNPTPDVYWERLDAPMPSRAAFKSFGQELHITDLQLSDAGQYQCMGLNTESQQRATKAFLVTVEMAPEWIEKPVSQEKSTNEKATFTCLGTATPEPVYYWFFNGILMSNDENQYTKQLGNRLIKSNINQITITNLTLQDHMNIQCNISNKHGYVYADVYINVLEEAPTILVPPPPSLKVAEGHSLIITCVVTGKPDPLITWYRDTSLITGGRFKIMPNGNLEISNVVMADAGDYRCQASNKFAKDVTSSTCKVQVRRKTRIEQVPLALEVIAGYDAKFTCSGSTDFDEAAHMKVYWEKDGKLISTSENRMTQNFQDNSLTISGTIVRDSGVYTCVITNGLDEDRAYAFLTVKDRPDAPTSVEVERCRENSTELKWIKGIENNAPVNYFVVQYSTTFNPDQWVSAKTVDYTQNTANIDLQPWVNYTFRVIATNKIGPSVPSDSTKKGCSTDPAIPYKNPDNLRSIGDARGKLKIEWTPMNELDHNGPNFNYYITIQREGQATIRTFTIDDWRNGSLQIDSTQAYYPYIVKIQAKNSKGDSRADVKNLTLFSYEDTPSARVQDITIQEMSDRPPLAYYMLTFSWDADWLDKTGRMNNVIGELKGFKVQYWRTNEKTSTFREDLIPIEDAVPSRIPEGNNARITTEYRMNYLSPYSNMQVQICVMNNYYVGPPSDAISITTTDGVPGPVQLFEAQVRSSNSFSLRWVAPEREDENGIIQGYDIAYQLVEGLKLGAIHDRDDQINDARTTMAVLSGLLPDRKYRVHIFARTKRGRGEGTFIEVRTTMKSHFTAPEFVIRNVQETQFNVTWSAGVYYGAHVVHYVEFRKEGAADWQQSTDEVLVNHKLINNLEKGTYYEVRVVAFDGYNRQFSDTEVIGTSGFARARALASNYGWFIGMMIAGLLFIAMSILLYYVHRKRKDVEEKPRSHRSRGDRGGIKEMDDFDRDSRAQYNDYHKDEKYEDYQPDGADGDKGYVDYKRESYGYDRDEDNQGYRDADSGYAKRDSDYYKDRGYDNEEYRDDYDDYDRDYDRDEYDRDFDQRYHDEDGYDDDDYDVETRPPAYKNKSYDDYGEPTDKNYRASVDDQAYEDYAKDASKFDDDGAPIEKSADQAASTFV